MKIFFNRIANRISGAEIYNLYLLEGLKQIKDIEITFSSDNKRLNERVRNLGVTAIYIDPHIEEIGTKKQFVKALLNLPLYFLEYKKLFKSIKRQDLIIFQSMTEKLFLTIPLTLQGNKVAWIEHGSLFNTRRAKVIKLLYKINSKFVKKIICVSKATSNDLIANGVFKEKTEQIYIGIDTKSFSPISPAEEYRIKTKLKLIGKDVVGYLGTITEEKGIKVFLEVASLLVKERKNVVFLIVGEGNLSNWLQEEVEKKDIIPYFYFVGHVDDVRHYLGIMDALLFPSSHNEGLSISLLEAGAMGVPVVASDMGGNRELVKSHINGLLCKTLSPSRLMKDVEEVVQQKKKYGKNAREVVINNFALEKNSMLFYRLFNNLL